MNASVFQKITQLIEENKDKMCGRTCDCCDGFLPIDDDGVFVGTCPECDTMYGNMCCECNDEFDFEELNPVENGTFICDGCRRSECECCGESYLYTKNSGIYCEACEEEKTCKVCGDLEDDTKNSLCDGCSKEQVVRVEKKRKYRLVIVD